MELLYSFTGCMAALAVLELIKFVFRPKKAEQPKIYTKRETPRNIGRFSDPLGNYEPYIDDRTHLYNTYVPKKTNRRGGETDE